MQIELVSWFFFLDLSHHQTMELPQKPTTDSPTSPNTMELPQKPTTESPSESEDVPLDLSVKKDDDTPAFATNILDMPNEILTIILLFSY